MDFTRYQNMAMTYRLPSADSTYALLNLSGEVGELHSLIAKAMRDGPKEDFLTQVKKELGDIQWMLAAIATDNGLSLQDIAQENLNKLASRQARNVLTGSGDNR